MSIKHKKVHINTVPERPVNSIFPGRRSAIATGTCVWCHQPVGEFRTPLDLKEFTISGLCQKCQDEVLI